MKPLPPYEQLEALFSYNSLTGEISAKFPRTSRPSGRRCDGFAKRGYRRVFISPHSYPAHRVAWKLHYKREPDGAIDHINGDVSDNRIVNLRPATQSQNCCNRRVKSTSLSGIKGLRQRPDGKWRAYLQINQRTVNLGAFTHKGDAIKALRQARRQAHREFAKD
jgi:hypothetical protein